MTCARCLDRRWVCELHTTQPWEHDSCGEPGMPCPWCQPSDAKPDLPAGWQSYVSSESTFGPPKERGSVRNVTLDGDPKSYQCEVRTLPGTGLRPGDYVWVEFGAYWAEVDGERHRQRGQWRQCRVLPNAATTQADVHVVLDPSPAKAPPDVPFG